MLSEEVKISYLKSVFKNIEENNAEEVYKYRAAILDQELRGVKSDNKIKRNRWFYLLRIVNDFIQDENANDANEEIIVKEFKDHPYYKFYADKKQIDNLIEFRKKSHSVFKEFDRALADIYYGLLHIANEVQSQSLQRLKEIYEGEEPMRTNLIHSVKIIRAQLPFLYERYAEFFSVITTETLKNEKDSKRRSRSKVENKGKESSWNFWFVFILIFIFIKLIAMCSRM